MMLEPHHDGSALYVSTDRPALGDWVTVRVRVPHGIGVDRLTVRVLQDAEPVYLPMRQDSSDSHETWTRASGSSAACSRRSSSSK